MNKFLAQKLSALCLTLLTWNFKVDHVELDHVFSVLFLGANSSRYH